MKQKTFVAIAILLAVLVSGIFLIMGLSSRTLLPIYLLIFLLILSAITLYAARKLLEDKLFVAAIILGLVMLSAAFYLTNLRTYYDVVDLYGNPDAAPEIQLLKTQNDYYYAYADYLNQSIVAYQSRISILENQLAVLKKTQLQAAIQQIETVPADTPIIVNNPPETSYITSTPTINREVQDD